MGVKYLAGLSPLQFAVWNVLMQKGPMTPSELLRQGDIECARPRIYIVLRDLRRKGLAEEINPISASIVFKATIPNQEWANLLRSELESRLNDLENEKKKTEGILSFLDVDQQIVNVPGRSSSRRVLVQVL